MRWQGLAVNKTAAMRMCPPLLVWKNVTRLVQNIDAVESNSNLRKHDDLNEKYLRRRIKFLVHNGIMNRRQVKVLATTTALFAYSNDVFIYDAIPFYQLLKVSNTTPNTRTDTVPLRQCRAHSIGGFFPQPSTSTSCSNEQLLPLSWHRVCCSVCVCVGPCLPSFLASHNLTVRRYNTPYIIYTAWHPSPVSSNPARPGSAPHRSAWLHGVLE